MRPTLSRFIANARDDATSAHSHAEYMLVRNLGRVLPRSTAPIEEGAVSAAWDAALQDAATTLLEEFGRAAARRGPDTLESLIL